MRRIENLGSKLCGGALALLIGAGAAWGMWRDVQPKFRDVTISAGEALPAPEDFATAYAVKEKCAAVTDLEAIDNNEVGEHTITLRHGAREEQVKLVILDTIAPELEVMDLEVPLGTQVQAEDFIRHLWDHSQVNVSFGSDIRVPEDYSPADVRIVAEDASGNVTEAECRLSVDWLRETAVLEYGQALTREDLLYDGEKDAALITDEDLQRINTAPLGQYELTSTSGGRTLSCHVTVQDTQGPVLELREQQVYPYSWVGVYDFVVSATDPSGDVTLTMVTTPDCITLGVQTIVIEAKDIHGNITTAETKLYVATDFYPPVFTGVSTTLSVEKHTQPDFLAGVSAWDNKDGAVTVTVDASRVNLDAAGTYFLTYSAQDSSGNVTTIRRKLEVLHDEEDTAALVASIAEQQEDDPEAIRDYVRNSIRYSSSWGGDDPVWTGFNNKHGNCYVHALCLKSILDLKGYNTQLIWVTNKTHYWLIIEMEEGVWRHIDPTPSTLHGRYSLMTDDQRYSTLSGRNWDRTQWPACE